MREWLVQLKGEEQDLKALSEIFFAPTCNIGRDEDGYYYLRSSDFALIADEGAREERAREERAKELVRNTNVAARLLLGGNYFGVGFDGMARIEVDGRRYRYVGTVLQMSWHVRTCYHDVSPEEAESLMGCLEDQEDQEVRRIINLFGKSLDSDTDGLARFVLAWAALEIFVKAVFGSYSLAFISDKVRVLADSKYSERVERAEKKYKSKQDKYPIVVRFIVVAADLAAVPSGSSVDRLDRDVSAFEDIYAVRNALYHDGALNISEVSLPLVAVKAQIFLSRYLRSYLSPGAPVQ